MDSIMQEEWRDIKGYERLYQVSSLGRVKSLEREVRCSQGYRSKKETILVPYRQSSGYLSVNLYKNNDKVIIHIHRLVAEAFIKNIDNKPCINHKDYDRANNSVTNLEWVTYKENAVYSSLHMGRKFTAEQRVLLSERYKGHKVSDETRNKMSTSKRGKLPNNIRRVSQFDKNGNLIKTFRTIKQATCETGINNICDCCKGKYKTAGGYIWKYEEYSTTK